MGIIGILIGLFGLLLVVLAFIFWIWMLIDCIQNQRLSGNEKVAWVLVIIFLHALGGLIYFLVGRQKI
jgi:cytochrome c oxidase assembly factor CtaG